MKILTQKKMNSYPATYMYMNNNCHLWRAVILIDMQVMCSNWVTTLKHHPDNQLTDNSIFRGLQNGVQMGANTSFHLYSASSNTSLNAHAMGHFLKIQAHFKLQLMATHDNHIANNLC